MRRLRLLVDEGFQVSCRLGVSGSLLNWCLVFDVDRLLNPSGRIKHQSRLNNLNRFQ